MDESNTASNDTSDNEPNHEANAASSDQGDAELLGATGRAQDSADAGTVKDPQDWVTGDEPMTGAQRSYLDTLARQAGQTVPANLSKAQASEQIDRLRQQTGRDG